MAVRVRAVGARLRLVRSRGFVVFVFVFVLVLGTASGCASHRATTATAQPVALYGDSLLYEARATIRSEFQRDPHLSLTMHAYPTRAPCDWFRTLEGDLARIHPVLVVLETAGNSSTPCMRDGRTGKYLAEGSPAFYAKYQRDLDAFFAAVSATRARTLLVASPPLGGLLLGDDEIRRHLLEIAATEARKYLRVETSELAARAVSGSNGAFAWTKSCLADETNAEGCTHGSIRVRAPDGIHFCPVLYGSFAAMLRGCTVYSSGAVRFGRAVASIVSTFVSSR